MAQHQQTSHRQHRGTGRKRKAWPWVVGICAIVIVALAAVAAMFAMQFMKQAKQVQAHENQAMAVLQKATSSSGDLSSATSNLDDLLRQAQDEAHQAREISHTSLWNFAAAVPFVGTNVATVQGMTDVVSGLVDGAVPKFLDVVNGLKEANFATDDGVNIKPIVDAGPAIKQANDALQQEITKYNALPQPTIGMVKDAYDQGHDKLNDLATQVDAMSNTFTFLPTFLGADGKQTYAVMAMTTSEVRSSGGLIGSVGEMTTDNGTIAIGEFRPNTEYLPYGSSDHTADEHRIFAEDGPLHMSFDIRDTAVYPDTQGVAEGMRSIWNRTPWGEDNPLNGVVMVDPVFVQELIALNGNMTLPDGTVLTGENTAEYLLNTIYKQYDSEQTDLVFGVVARQCIDDMFENVDLTKLMKLAGILDTMAKERHFSMYSFDADAEESILAAGFTAQTPVDESHPTVGIYLTEQNASKMDWYVKRTAKVTCLECKDDGSCTYHVEYSLHNTLTQEELAQLPDYIAGMSAEDRGKAIEKILFYPPAGGSISNIVELDGSPNAVQKETLNGTSIYRSTVTVNPGQVVTYSFDVTTSGKAKTPLSIDQTPLTTSGSNVEYVDESK